MIKKYRRMVKPFDIIIVSFLFVLSCLPTMIVAVETAHIEKSKLYAVISFNGEEVDRFLLTGNEKQRLITYYPAPGKYNIIEIDGERIRDKSDNSPQQIAVRTGWIQSLGQTSLNLPHRMLIEIVSDNPTEVEIDVLAR